MRWAQPSWHAQPRADLWLPRPPRRARPARPSPPPSAAPCNQASRCERRSPASKQRHQGVHTARHDSTEEDKSARKQRTRGHSKRSTGHEHATHRGFGWSRIAGSSKKSNTRGAFRQSIARSAGPRGRAAQRKLIARRFGSWWYTALPQPQPCTSNGQRAGCRAGAGPEYQSLAVATGQVLGVVLTQSPDFISFATPKRTRRG